MNSHAERLLDLEEAFGLGSDWPISKWRAWDHGASKTSQLRALHGLVGHITLLVWGGNKSGKTELNLAAGVAYGLGGDHPAVQEWLRANGLPSDLIPPGPGAVWFLAPTHDDSKRYHRARVEHLVGVDEGFEGWRSREARQEATLRIPVPGYKKPATYVFKAHSQGVNGCKGDSIRYLCIDEECPQPMFNEALKRLGEDEKARAVFSMTPDVYRGVSWVKARFIEGREPGATEINIHTAHNPNIPSGLMEQRVAGMTDVERAAALTGEFGTVHGLIFPDFTRGIHVIEDRPVPPSWPRYATFDYGWNNPNVILRGALDPDGILEVYAEFYQNRLTARQLGEIFLAICAEADEHAVKCWGDPTALTSNEELRAMGIPISAAFRDVEEGYKAVNAALAGDPPLVRVHRGCARFLAELPNYRRGPNGKAIKVNDHGCDAFRYMITGVNDHARLLVDWTGALQSGDLSRNNPWNV